MQKHITQDTKFVAFTLNHLKSLSLVFIKGFANNVAGFLQLSFFLLFSSFFSLFLLLFLSFFVLFCLLWLLTSLKSLITKLYS